MTGLTVDVASSTPVYEQVVDQLTRLIVGGALPPRHRLPAIRQLAADLGVAPGTVARAYQELEHAGLITTRRPQGSYVMDFAKGQRPQPKELLRVFAEGFAEQARQLGVSRDDALSALRAAYDRS